nr:acylneuraminate cytidylyltransferase family protein [Bacteriovorax sp. HI3]
MMRLCTICARGGSKGVKGKNLKVIGGLPLIAHSIRQAKASGLFEYVVVSSDSPDILNAAMEYGADFTVQRPEELATDTAAKLPVIKHCAMMAEKITNKKFDVFVDLDCTSPLRTIEDIKGVVEMTEVDDCSNVITGMTARRSPYFNLVEMNENGFVNLAKKLDRPIVRRQDAPKCFDMNASIYSWKREEFFKLESVLNERTKIFVMPEERSIDIDSDLDFEIVKLLMEKHQ